jgi:hypothetical protein
MKLSIIIPNTDSLLIAKITKILQDEIRNLNLHFAEILVVGTDRPGLVQTNEHIRFLSTEETTSYASDKRNIGIQEAKGDLLLFLDDDCIPCPGWVDQHLQYHVAGHQIVGGAVSFGKENYFQLSDNISAFHDLLPYTPAGFRDYLCAANLSVERSVIDIVGLLPGHRNRAEDLEWTVRMRKTNFSLYFASDILVTHDPPRKSLKSVWDHWVMDAPDTLTVRLKYGELLNTPKFAKYQLMYSLGAPFVAVWATIRSFRHPQTIKQYWHTLPLVFLTKIAWCWGAFSNFSTVTNR